MAAQKIDTNLLDDDENDSSLRKSRYIRFLVLVAGIIFFFGCHNYMQELIMSLPGFKVCLSKIIRYIYLLFNIFIGHLNIYHSTGGRIFGVLRSTGCSSLFIF